MIRPIAWILAYRRAPAGPSDPRLLAFARGLVLGALIGAAIAGSSLWSRQRSG
jgi:hypothetical protein